MNRITGFTLAEVLITLGIIGIVAAMTMPSLIASHKEKEMIVRFKKAHSVLSNAYLLSKNDNSDMSDWTLREDAVGQAEDIYNYFKPYLKIIKDCGFEQGCFSDTVYSPFDSQTWNLTDTYRYWIVLSDGTSLGFLPSSSNTPGIYVDVNGLKKPNKVGVDIFQFMLRNEGVITYDEMSVGVPTCYSNPWACSSWVLANENLDYLHCNDLNWSGKTKCK